MSTSDETIRKAIDEAVAPLAADQEKYLAPGASSLMVSRAELHYVFDQYHTRLLDFSADMAPIGHGHPFVVDAIREHLNYYIRTAPVGDHVLRWPVEYARAIVETFTPEDVEPRHQVLFTEGEHEAVLTALRMARDKTGVSCVGLVDTDVHSWVTMHNLIDHSLLSVGEFFLDDFRWNKIGALLISLVTEDGRVLDPRWIQTVVDRAKQNGVLVIIDESRTGFGRTGAMWGQQSVNVDADITVLGGPVGGGLALGAVVAPSNYFTRPNVDLSPQAGSPVACAAGAAVLRAVNPGVLEHVKEASGAFDDALQELIDQFPEHAVASYGMGLLRTIEFRTDILAREFEVASRRHGLLVAPPVGSSLILTPTLIASESELKRGVDLMADVLLEWHERSNA